MQNMKTGQRYFPSVLIIQLAIVVRESRLLMIFLKSIFPHIYTVCTNKNRSFMDQIVIFSILKFVEPSMFNPEEILRTQPLASLLDNQ